MLLDQQHQADVSGVTPMPVENMDDASVLNTASAETVTWLFNDTGVWASATGEAAGTMCAGKLGYEGVTNELGGSVGTISDTSFSFAAATRAATLISVPEEAFSKMESMSVANKVAYIATWLDTNGDYAIDHRRGQVWMLAKAIVADDAATYKYRTPIAGGGGPTADVNLNKVGGTAVTLGQKTKAASIPVVLPSDQSIGGADVDDSAFTAGTDKGQVVMGFYDTTDDEVDDGDKGALKMTAKRRMEVRDEAYDTSTQANRGAEINPLNMQFVGETLIDETNIAETTTAYAYIDMAGYRTIGIQAETSGATPTDVLTITLEATMQDDGTAAASCDYQDVTTALTGSASFVDTDFISLVDTPFAVKYLRVKYTTSTGGGNDCDLVVFAKKLY